MLRLTDEAPRDVNDSAANVLYADSASSLACRESALSMTAGGVRTPGPGIPVMDSVGKDPMLPPVITEVPTFVIPEYALNT
jgi:hypothetical protein